LTDVPPGCLKVLWISGYCSWHSWSGDTVWCPRFYSRESGKCHLLAVCLNGIGYSMKWHPRRWIYQVVWGYHFLLIDDTSIKASASIYRTLSSQIMPSWCMGGHCFR